VQVSLLLRNVLILMGIAILPSLILNARLRPLWLRRLMSLDVFIGFEGESVPVSPVFQFFSVVCVIVILAVIHTWDVSVTLC